MIRRVSSEGGIVWVTPARVGRRAFGVPPGGPFDPFAAAVANALVGNEAGAPVLEISAFGAVFEVVQPIPVSVVGAGEPDGARVLVPGDLWRVAAHQGARAYVAMPGGAVPDEEGFRAGTQRQVAERRLGEPVVVPDPEPVLNLLAGPQASVLPMDVLCATVWTVAPASDRVGLRLSGGGVGRPTALASEPMCVGAVQVTPSGELLVAGPDGPTLGGYPKVAVVVNTDLRCLAHLRPGNTVRFRPSTLADALRSRAEARRREAETLACIREAVR